MSFQSLLAMVCIAGACVSLSQAAQELNGLIQYPVLSPSAEQIVFSAAGDLWSVPVSGGAAFRLTSHPGTETQSKFKGDGSMIVFESDRDGAQNLYTLDVRNSNNTLVGGDIQRVTTSDRAEMLGGFSQDGKSVLFSTYLYPEIYRQPRMYQAPLDGGPMTRVSEAFGRGPSTRADSPSIYFVRGYYYPQRVAYRGPGNLDIWKLDPTDNSFTQVTQFMGNDMDPCPLPDGSLLYLSSRDGQYNLVRLNAGATDQDGNAITQLTKFKADSEHPVTIAHGVRDLAVSENGSKAVFVVWNTMYTLDLTNPRATPKPIDVSFGSDLSSDQVVRKNISREVSEAAVHPSGDAVAQIARGELFVRSTQEDHPTRRITDSNARDRDIAWSPDGVTLYFAADDEDSLGSIYAATVALAREDIEPKPSPDVYEPAEVEEAEAVEEEPAVDPEQSADEPTSEEPETESKEDTADDKEKDKKKEEPKVDQGKRWATALRFDIVPVVQDASLAFAPTPSPDGTKLMYLRDRGDIVIRDLSTGQERVVSENWSEPDIIWASDSRHIVFAATDLDFNSDIFILDTQLNDDGSNAEPINITMHPDIDHSPRLSHDGKVLTFFSDRDNENWAFDVYRVYLDRSLEGLRDYEIAQYYEDAVAAAKKLKPIEPVVFGEDANEESEPDSTKDTSAKEKPESKKDIALSFDTDDAYLRVRRLTSTPEGESDLVMTPAGDRIAFSTVIDGDRSFVSVDSKGKDRKTIKSGGVGNPRVSLDGSSLSFVSGGQASTTTPVGGKTTSLPIDASITINTIDELAQKFNEASGRFGMSFYHPTLKGLDWSAMTDRYRQLVMQTRTNQAFLRLMNLMWGEVDGSHTGTWGGDGYSAASPNNGYLGIDFTPTADGYRIDAIIKGGPIDEMHNGPAVGDTIVAIGDKKLTGAKNASGLIDLHAALAGTARDELLMEFIAAESKEHKFAIVTPAPYSTMSVLRYEYEVANRRAQVDELSGGKLGYLHIRGMGLPQVRDYERDLFAAANGKEGLIIDVRDNGGGWTTDILLASLTAPNHAYTIPRGADPDKVRKDNYPRDRRLIYAYSRPINVLINENSFSNAEIFAHSIRNTKRGTLIGKQTFGGVISTGSFSLIDGTTVRRPFRGWYLPDGTDMDNNGAKPDIEVLQLPSDEAAGKDPQLEAAVKELLSRTSGS